MSVAPNAGIVDLDNFLPPTSGSDGLQGQVPKPLAGQQDYVLTASGWVALSSLGTLIYQGTWDASTNTPTLTSSVGTAGYYYVVSVAGNTDLNGITTWTVGDWALFNGSVWQKIEGGSTVDITGGQINNTLIGNNTPAAGTFTTLTATGQTSLGGVAGSESLRVNTRTSANAYIQVQGGVSGSTRANIGLVSAVGGQALNIFNGTSGPIVFSSTFSADTITEQFRVSHTGSAVNYVQVTGAATGSGPTISAQGSDTNVALNIASKAAQNINFRTGASSLAQFTVVHNGATIVNQSTASGSATGFAPIFGVQGSDTNISQVFQPKGTGAIDLAAGSSGVNISNGGTVTAVTLTGAGTGYTSFPTATVSTPTTAGGVQAVVSFPRMYPSGVASIASGGTGYSVNDVLTLVGGTPVTTAATLTVSSVSGGVITGVTITAANSYTVLPSAPTSVTGGTGTGATFNMTYSLGAAVTISNAGSGYVEQPTVSFSGGGGSGAAAYATVGSVTTIKSLGSSTTGVTNASLQFSTPAFSSALTIRDISGADTGVSISPATGYTNITALGATNATLMLASAGTNSIYFNTQGTSQTNQMRVSHTASAVNYVQVTGAATGGRPTISAQGSDASAGLNIYGKAGGSMIFSCNGGSVVALQLNNTSSGVNYLQMAAGVAGAGPAMSVAGSDTNIDLTLTPKGTGQVKATNATNMIVVSNGQSGFGSFLAQSSTGSAYLFGYSGGSEVGRVYFSSGSTGIATGSPSTTQFVVAHTASAVNYVQVTGNATGGGPSISAQGSDANVSMYYIGKGIGGHVFTSGSSANIQFVVNNTTSAANYVQVTGAATTSPPTISAQGSDSNTGLNIAAKGTGIVSIATQRANYTTISGNAAGSAPSFGVAGSDTNIDLALTPKGTGLVRFGTYTAGAPAATGYISIKAADGTTYKVLVGT